MNTKREERQSNMIISVSRDRHQTVFTRLPSDRPIHATRRTAAKQSKQKTNKQKRKKEKKDTPEVGAVAQGRVTQKAEDNNYGTQTFETRPETGSVQEMKEETTGPHVSGDAYDTSHISRQNEIQ